MEFLIIWLVSSLACTSAFWWTFWETAELKRMSWMDLLWFHFLCLVPVFNTIALIFVTAQSFLDWLEKKLRGKPFAHKDWRK